VQEGLADKKAPQSQLAVALGMQSLRQIDRLTLGIVAGLSVLVLWAYWPTLATMSHKWLHDPQYSHGYLVPVFAAVLLWLRRSSLDRARVQPSIWGLALLAGGFLLRMAGAYVYMDWLDAVSLVPVVAGLFVLVGGWAALRWAWPAVAFLAFMIPLPYWMETALAHPLQRIATNVSTYFLQTLGLTALNEGNTIVLSRGRIGISEACSGLSMMVIFFALSTAVAILIKRPWPDKLVIVISAIPIAVIANVARIVATGAAYDLISPQAAQALFHDWAGWLMMPLALGLLWLELWCLSRLLAPPSRVTIPPLTGGFRQSVAAPTSAAPTDKTRRKRQKKTGPIPLPFTNQ
jgi:exosortase